MGIQYAYAADIVKAERDEETGDLIVYGKATGPDLDLDEQICDETWLKTAMPGWFEFANLREMHQPIAAGVGIELEQQGDDWFLKSRCVDPNTAKKIEAGVLKGYSVGIKSPKVVKDADAPGGRITGGDIVEISYVDRPCNPTAKMAIAKAAGADATLQPVEAEQDEVTIKVAGSVFKPSDLAKLVAAKKSADPAGVTADTVDGPADEDADTGIEPDVAEETEPSGADEAEPAEESDAAAKSIVITVNGSVLSDEAVTAVVRTALKKRAFSTAEREQAADEGAAMPDGSFPIKSVKDLKNAIKAVGRAKDPAAVKKHIKQRAKSLGREDLIPEGWKAADTDLTKAEAEQMVHNPAELAAIRSGLIRLIHAELDELENGEPELWDVKELLCALGMYIDWWEDEAWNGETESPRETPKPAGVAEPSTETAVKDADEEETVEPDTTKTSEPEASEVDSSDEDDDTTSSTAKTAVLDENRLTELVKSAVADATKSLTEQAAEERKALEAELKTVKDNLAKVLALPEPGGPVLNRTALQAATTKAAADNQAKAEIAELRKKADQMQGVDAYTAQGYRARALALEKSLAL